MLHLDFLTTSIYPNMPMVTIPPTGSLWRRLRGCSSGSSESRCRTVGLRGHCIGWQTSGPPPPRGHRWQNIGTRTRNSTRNWLEMMGCHRRSRYRSTEPRPNQRPGLWPSWPIGGLHYCGPRSRRMGAQGSSSGGQGQTGHLKTEFWRGAAGVASDHVILSLPAVSGSQCQGNCTASECLPKFTQSQAEITWEFRPFNTRFKGKQQIKRKGKGWTLVTSLLHEYWRLILTNKAIQWDTVVKTRVHFISSFYHHLSQYYKCKIKIKIFAYS